MDAKQNTISGVVIVYNHLTRGGEKGPKRPFGRNHGANSESKEDTLGNIGTK